MPTIKGPIKITGGFNASAFLKEKAPGVKIKLPFKATGWKSSKTPPVADMSGIEAAKAAAPPPAPTEKPKAEAKPSSLPAE